MPSSDNNFTKIDWPDIIFGPVNLWNMPPAWFFYLSPTEKNELIMAAQHGEIL